MRYAVWAVGFLVAMVALAFVGWGWRWFAAPIEGKVGARETIQSGASRIANYEHFFNLCAAIQGNEAQLDALDDEAKATPPSEMSRVRANITGVRAARAGAIAQYNADARKSYTQGQFRDSDLPYQIPASDWQKGSRTSCVA